MSADINETELRRLDLNLLLVFTAIMRTGSAKAAAGKLYMGSSAISMALARLRRHVGDPLFVRTREGLRPTRYAEALHAKLEPALAAIGAAMTGGVDFDLATTRETFRIGMVDDFEWWVLPPLQRRIGTFAPHARIVVQAVDLAAVRDALDGGLVDLVLTAHPAERATGLPNAQFFAEDFVAVAPGKVPLPARLMMEDYLSLPHALVSAGGGASGIIDTELERRGHDRRVALSVRHFLTLPFVIADGGMIATVPRRPARILVDRFGLQWRELPFPSPVFPVGMIWHGRTQTYPASAWLRSQVEETMIDLGAG